MNNLLKNTALLSTSVGGFVATLAALGFYKNFLFTVQGGHQAVLFNKLSGIKDRSYREGWHIKLPYFQVPFIYETRSKPKKYSSETPTKDLQNVHIELRVLYKPAIQKLRDLHRTLGPDYDERVLPSIVQEVLKSIVAQHNAAQLLSLREQISLNIKDSLQRRGRDFFIQIDDVSITELTFTREFQQAIEAKQVAYQEAERAKFLVDRAEQEKRSSIIKAQGEARSAELIGNAMRENQAFIELRRIEAAKDIAEKLSRFRGRAFLNADMLFLNLSEDFAPDLTKKKAE